MQRGKSSNQQSSLPPEFKVGALICSSYLNPKGIRLARIVENTFAYFTIYYIKEDRREVRTLWKCDVVRDKYKVIAQRP
jgi:hypothetical protein